MTRHHRLYRWILRAYPRHFRQAHGRSLEQIFGDLLREAQGRSAALPVLQFWWQTFGDVMRNAIPLRLEALRGDRQTTPANTRPRENTVNGLIHETRQATRRLSRRPLYTAAICTMLALGIGANATIFSLVDSLLLRPLPYENSAELVTVWPGQVFSKAEFSDLQQQMTTLQESAAIWPNEVTWQEGDRPERLASARVSHDYFRLLGVQPLLGRTFTRDETEPGDALVVLGHELWQERFGGRRTVLGQVMHLDGQPHEIIGVMPDGFFSLPSDGSLWRPLRMDRNQAEWFSISRLHLIGRLDAQIDATAATEQLRTLCRQLSEQQPNRYASDYGRDARVSSLSGATLRTYRSPVVFLQGAVVLVLLIACTNIAHLLIAGRNERARELALRLALGAGRAQVLRASLLEGAILSVAGAAAGLLIARAGLALLVRPADLPSWVTISTSWNVIALTLLMTVLCALTLGVAPVPRRDLGRFDRLRQGRGTTFGARPLQRRALVAAEVALALVLTTGAGLMLRSVWKLHSVDPGFDVERLLTLRLDPPETSDAYENPERRVDLYQRVRERVAGLPGIEAVVLGQQVALGEEPWGTAVRLADQAEDTPGHPVKFMTVGADYFRGLRVPIVEGRDFGRQDHAAAPPVVIINQTMARQLWPTEGAIGRRVRLWGQEVEVVGISADVRQLRLEEDAPPTLFRPLSQSPQIVSMSLFVRTAGEPLAAVRSVREAIWEVDNRVPLSKVRSLDQVLAESIVISRLLAQVLTALAGLALALLIGGVFSVASCLVSQRTREFGLRLAIGARPRQILASVLAEGLAPVLVGAIVGLIGVGLLGRLLTSLLYGVTPTEPTILAGVVLGLVLVAIVACLVPARRATRVEPTVALRHDG